MKSFVATDVDPADPAPCVKGHSGMAPAGILMDDGCMMYGHPYHTRVYLYLFGISWNDDENLDSWTHEKCTNLWRLDDLTLV